MTLSEATILIVDDEPILRLTFGLLLRQRGATTHEASDGAEALSILRRERIDVMLTDKQMPIMDGMTLLRTMAMESIQVPSVLFASAVDPDLQEELDQLHVLETIEKPVHPEDMIAALARALTPLPFRAAAD